MNDRLTIKHNRFFTSILNSNYSALSNNSPPIIVVPPDPTGEFDNSPPKIVVPPGQNLGF